jgi:predicted NBD/HSP70 family sugar kinase
VRRPQRGTLRDVRRGNRSLLLRTLYFTEQPSRQDLSRLTGLSPATVSNVVSDLISDGIVVEAGAVDSDGGRPRTLLAVRESYGYVVGVDVGETRVRLALFDLAMTEKAKAEYALKPGGHEPSVVVGHILAGLRSVLADAGIEESQVLGIGIGVPGIVEQCPELLIHARAFGWDGVPLGDRLRAETAIAVFADNGAKTMGQAELWFGAGRGALHMVMTLIGSGVGASVITDGTTYRGMSSSAGEWGHTTIVVDGRPCRCGARGCLEAYVGAKGILGSYATDLPAGDEESALAAMLADEAARPVLDDVVAYLGAGLANLINLFNPERIILGGWAGLLIGRALLPEIRAAAALHALAQPMAQVSIELGRLGPEAVALGAATLVVEDFLLRSDTPRRC